MGLGGVTCGSLDERTNLTEGVYQANRTERVGSDPSNWLAIRGVTSARNQETTADISLILLTRFRLLDGENTLHNE